MWGNYFYLWRRHEFDVIDLPLPLSGIRLFLRGTVIVRQTNVFGWFLFRRSGFVRYASMGIHTCMWTRQVYRMSQQIRNSTIIEQWKPIYTDGWRAVYFLWFSSFRIRKSVCLLSIWWFVHLATLDQVTKVIMYIPLISWRKCTINGVAWCLGKRNNHNLHAIEISTSWSWDDIGVQSTVFRTTTTEESLWLWTW